MTGRAGARGTTIEPETTPPPAPSPGREGGNRRLAGGLIVAGIAVVAILLVSGLLIQRLLPEPYPELASVQLPTNIANATEVMTNSDRPGDNEPIQWVRGRGHTVNVFSQIPGQPQAEVEHVAKLSIPQNASRAKFDVSSWYPWRAEALFSFEQRPTNLAITVSPTWKSDGHPVNFVAPLSAPPKGTTREFFIAAWGGIHPDLFVITRGDPESRPVLQILSSESGFRRQLYAARLPYRGLSPRTWSMQIAPIIGLPKKSEQRIFKGDRLDLVMIHHDPGEKHSMVHVLLGETGFEWDAIRRDLDDSGDLPRGTEFLVGSHQGATAIYEVQRQLPRGPHLWVFGLTNPPALQ